MTHVAAYPSGQRATVLGGGAWGTVLALLLARRGHDVALWFRSVEQAAAVQTSRVNQTYLPGYELPTNLSVTADLGAALSGTQLAFLAVPVKALRELLRAIAPVVAATSAGHVPLVSCSKGIEIASFSRLSQVIESELPGTPVAVLSGPNLASEIADGKAAATTVASRSPGLAESAQALLQQPSFRVYTSTDMVGVEVGGALKNVIALAAGMSDGLGLGDNAKAGIITRGLAEMVRFGEAQGGEAKTLYGLSGLGDLVATCSSDRSRNHTAGWRLARGATREELKADNLTAEGIPTAKALNQHARAAAVELPICNEVYNVVYDGKPARAALFDLMTRERRAE
ncbi:MAG: NAD(P)-dependent glycerol-3-phosphate dehydrogenase [Trueperaceae bacterium]|nr:NAD(P)-dependent glycerol-3-phosphate dehydrogenase [Trueperaceae bacterium]